jgi:hypothetical protein
MQDIASYKYHFRPGYGSHKLLIEIYHGAERDEFITDLMTAILGIHPVLAGQMDLWMNDEILLEMDSEYGSFVISKDIWGLGFILADDNQVVMHEIDALLTQDARFEKVEVDFERYRLAP